MLLWKLLFPRAAIPQLFVTGFRVHLCPLGWANCHATPSPNLRGLINISGLDLSLH